MVKEYKKVTNEVATRNIDVKAIFANWKSPFISRDQLFEVTGGLIKRENIRNLDSAGLGIKGMFHIGYRSVAYPVASVIEFLEERIAKYNKPKQSVKNCE